MISNALRYIAEPVYRKPVVYQAVKKIEKHIKKEVKKNEMTQQQATYLYNKTLDVAINIISEDTGSFEKVIQNTKQPDQLLSLFNDVNLISY